MAAVGVGSEDFAAVELNGIADLLYSPQIDILPALFLPLQTIGLFEGYFSFPTRLLLL